MKKLLALVLCVMLFVSMIPSAFAINLQEAYDARDELYAAYGYLGAATAYSNAVNMVETLLKRDLTSDDVYGTWVARLGRHHVHWIKIKDGDFEDLNPINFELVGAVSYNGLFELVGPAIYRAYDTAGTAYAASVATNTIDPITNAVEAKADALIDAAAPAFAPIVIGGPHFH